MQHYAPHTGAKFEGHFSKFDLASGAHVALIVCTVPGAKQRPHMVSFTYVPQSGDPTKIFQRELWAEELHMIKTDRKTNEFELRVPGSGFIRCIRSDEFEDESDQGLTTYEISHPDFEFKAQTSSRTAWCGGLFQTPEGPLVYLPLPLHWHVHSLSSKAQFDLAINDKDYAGLDARDSGGRAYVHEEKNWSNSFPSAHIWVQARNHAKGSGINIAGGRILGVLEAYLLGYRAEQAQYSIDARPPIAMGLAGVWAPLMTVHPDWDERAFHLKLRTAWNRRIEVKVTAPKGTFFGLSSPFSDGHRENFLGQSFKATARVQVYETDWWSLTQPWRLVNEEMFEDASLEFGGQYYPPAGSKQRTH